MCDSAVPTAALTLCPAFGDLARRFGHPTAGVGSLVIAQPLKHPRAALEKALALFSFPASKVLQNSGCSSGKRGAELQGAGNTT